MEKEIAINYSNENITVVWKPKVCIHSKRCWQELSSVFKPTEKKWIHMDGADDDTIIRQVNCCPSGALSYFNNKNEK